MSPLDWSGGDDPRTPAQRKADDEIRKKMERERDSDEAIDARRRFLVSRELKKRFGMDVTPEMMAASKLKVPSGAPPGAFPTPEPRPEGAPAAMPELSLSVKRIRAYDAGFEFYTVDGEALVKVERDMLKRGMQFMFAPRTLSEGPMLKYGRCGQIVAIDDEHIFYTEISGVFE